MNSHATSIKHALLETFKELRLTVSDVTLVKLMDLVSTLRYEILGTQLPLADIRTKIWEPIRTDKELLTCVIYSSGIFRFNLKDYRQDLQHLVDSVLVPKTAQEAKYLLGDLDFLDLFPEKEELENVLVVNPWLFWLLAWSMHFNILLEERTVELDLNEEVSN